MGVGPLLVLHLLRPLRMDDGLLENPSCPYIHLCVMCLVRLTILPPT